MRVSCLIIILTSGLYAREYLQIIILQKERPKTFLNVIDLKNQKLYYCRIDEKHLEKFKEAFRKIYPRWYDSLPQFVCVDWDTSDKVAKEVADSIVFGSFDGLFLIGEIRPSIIRFIWEKVCIKYKMNQKCKFTLGLISLSDTLIAEINRLFGQASLYTVATIEPYEYFTYTPILSAEYIANPIGEVLGYDEKRRLLYLRILDEGISRGDLLVFKSSDGTIQDTLIFPYRYRPTTHGLKPDSAIIPIPTDKKIGRGAAVFKISR